MSESPRSTIDRQTDPQFREAVAGHIVRATGPDGPRGQVKHNRIRNGLFATVALIAAYAVGSNVGRQTPPAEQHSAPVTTEKMTIAQLTSKPKPGQELPKNGVYKVELGDAVNVGVSTALAYIAEAEGLYKEGETPPLSVSEATNSESIAMANRVAEQTQLDTIGPDTPIYVAPEHEIVDPSILDPKATAPITITKVG